MQETNPITEVAKFFKNIDYDKLINNAGLGLEYIKKQAAKGSKETTIMMLELYFVMMSEKTSKFNKRFGSCLSISTKRFSSERRLWRFRLS